MLSKGISITYIIESMELNGNRGLVLGYDPINNFTTALVPEIYIVKKNVHEVKVGGRFEKGQIIRVSGKYAQSCTGKLLKAETEDYVALAKMFYEILGSNYNQTNYHKIRHSYPEKQKWICDKLFPETDNATKKAITEPYSLCACLKC